jgi:uncharacterized membrane protein YhhN
MLGRFRAAVIFCLSILLLASPAAALEPSADDPWYVTAGNIGASSFDVLLLRPLGFVATVAGLACFTAALPFSAIAQEIGTSWDIFVVAPAESTFKRPIGDF